MIRIAQASSSENYTKYGKSPNQRRTGASRTKPEGNLDGELNVVNWYGGWAKVYRPIDPVIADRIANFMYRAVANGNYIGYSWSGNTGVFDALKAKGSTDPMDIDTLVNCDCASLIGAAIYYSGVRAEGLRALTTWKMETVLSNTNAFNVISSKEMCDSGKGIRRGDILWMEGHAACALDTDDSGVRVQLNNDGLYFTNANGNTIGSYPNNVNMRNLICMQKIAFYGVEISAGTIGTRGAQKAQSISKAGYRPVMARLSYVSDSTLANVVPFFGNGDDKTLHVNFYRVTKNKCTVDATVVVVYVREEVSSISW